MIAAILISIIMAGGAYEGVALGTRKVPTITDILQSHPAVTVGALIGIIFAAIWAVLHVAGWI